MKETLFARPNLKMFVLAAILLVAVQQFFGPNSAADDTDLLLATSLNATPQDATIELLIRRSLEKPTSQNYLLLSDCYRKRGDTKKAMHYLRKASLAAHLDDE